VSNQTVKIVIRVDGGIPSVFVPKGTDVEVEIFDLDLLEVGEEVPGLPYDEDGNLPEDFDFDKFWKAKKKKEKLQEVA